MFEASFVDALSMEIEMSFEDKGKTHRRTVSAGDAFSTRDLSSSLEKCNFTDSISHNGKIAQAYSPKFTRHFIQGLSATWSGMPPKVPQPEQAELTFNVIGGGLREIIKLAQVDLINLKFAVESSSLSSHQIKTAERYLKKLEFHLSKLEELQEKYEVQKKMRDGIRSMTNAYIISHGKKRDSALHNVHTGYKECNELLCAYEINLQHMMGTFTFEMIGIQGFARICCGDIFEIVLKHGDQKWRSRGYILKNSKQSWENKRILFKAIFKEPLYIKAIEVRGLGKNIVLGNKYCETKDLFSAHPQQMTINLNPSGSLKLSLVITWNPVHGFVDNIPLHSRQSFGSQSALIKDAEVFNSLKMPYKCREDATYDKKESVQHIFSSCDKISSITNCESVGFTSAEKYTIQPGSDFVNSSLIEFDTYSDSFCKVTHKTNIDGGSQVWSSVQSINSSDCNSVEMASSSDFSCSNSSRLHNSLHNLSSSLESILGQYPELQDLHNYVLEVQNLIKFQRQKSLGSDVSISIKSALGCFDFLNTAVDEENFDTECESTTETKIGSNTAHLHYLDNENPSANSLGCSPEPFSSGVEQLDIAITTHADYCLKLTDKLCSTCPLKCLELSSLEQLQKQASCFASFLHLMRKKSASGQFFSCGEIFMNEESELKFLWLRLATGDFICVSTDLILPGFEKLAQSFVVELNTSAIQEVASRMLCQILDRKTFGPETVVTVLQFKLYFSEKGTIHSAIQDVAKEVQILDNLHSKEASRVEAAFAMLKLHAPFKDALLEACCMLIDGEVYLKRLCESYLKDIASEFIVRKQAIATYSTGLESEERRIRHGSCAALRVLNAFECSEELVYISFADDSQQVRHEAKIALFAFGDTGRKLYDEYEKFASCTRN